jgi:MoxR-like ATPase
MEERQVTVLGETHKLSAPFFVLATQNPVELEGTYPLPEAQLDRFLVKLLLSLPDSKNLKEILNRTTGVQYPEVKAVLPQGEIVKVTEELKKLVRQVIVADPLQDVLVRMILALTPSSEFATNKVKRYVRFGPGPRGAQAVIMLAKVHALLDSRINLAYEDLKSALVPCLRHRLILNFQAEADQVDSDQILNEVKNAK